jgi:hypothetical protein
MPTLSQAELDVEVLFILGQHVGKENAVNRWEMVRIIDGKPVPFHLQNDDNPRDREIRFAIGRLRAAGHLICDLGDGNGRYMAANEAEFWELYSYYVKPIKARAEIALALKKSAARRWPNVLQMSLFNLDQLETV